MATKLYESFAEECEAEILAFASPFKEMSDAARIGLSAFLQEDVELGGVEASREAHCENQATRVDFFDRLAFVGTFAGEAGLRRLKSAASRGDKGEMALVLEDLQEASGIVSRWSITGLCEPG